jgi:hypothetical protein
LPARSRPRPWRRDMPRARSSPAARLPGFFSV